MCPLAKCNVQQQCTRHTSQQDNTHCTLQDYQGFDASKRESTFWPPKHTKLALDLGKPVDAGNAVCCRIAFSNSRRFGRVRLCSGDPRAVSPWRELGFDPLEGPWPLQTIASVITSKRSPIKSVLLDQSVIAGIGNWMADDVLLQARLHPGTRSCDLTPDEISTLTSAIKTVAGIAVKAGADASKFPRHWLFHGRWTMARKTLDGKSVSTTKIGGRTTFFVPSVQKKAKRGTKRSRRDVD